MQQMTEAWGIALLTIGTTLFLAVLGWIAYELRGIRKDMKFFVLKDTCSSDMGRHCTQIGDLYKKANENQQRIAKLEQSVQIYHKDN
jgi:hypothetical protein